MLGNACSYELITRWWCVGFTGRSKNRTNWG